MARTPFKLKSSPAKGKLGDFFKSLGENLKRNRRDIAGPNKGKKQKDITTSKYYKPKKTTKAETKEVKSEVKTKKVETTPKKSKVDWTKAPKLNTQKRRDWYTKHNLAQDKTTEL